MEAKKFMEKRYVDWVGVYTRHVMKGLEERGIRIDATRVYGDLERVSGSGWQALNTRKDDWMNNPTDIMGGLQPLEIGEVVGNWLIDLMKQDDEK